MKSSNAGGYHVIPLSREIDGKREFGTLLDRLSDHLCALIAASEDAASNPKEVFAACSGRPYVTAPAMYVPPRIRLQEPPFNPDGQGPSGLFGPTRALNFATRDELKIILGTNSTEELEVLRARAKKKYKRMSHKIRAFEILQNRKARDGEARCPDDVRFFANHGDCAGNPVGWSKAGFGIWGALRGLAFAYRPLARIGKSIQKLTGVSLYVDDIPHFIARPPRGERLEMHTDGGDMDSFLDTSLKTRSFADWQRVQGVQMLAHLFGGRGEAEGGTEVFYPFSVQRYRIMLVAAKFGYANLEPFPDKVGKVDYNWLKVPAAGKGKHRQKVMSNPVLDELIAHVEKYNTATASHAMGTAVNKDIVKFLTLLHEVQPLIYNRLFEPDTNLTTPSGFSSIRGRPMVVTNMADVNEDDEDEEKDDKGPYVFVWPKGLPHMVWGNRDTRLTLVLPFSCKQPDERGQTIGTWLENDRRRRIYERVTLLAALADFFRSKGTLRGATDLIQPLLTYEQSDRFHDGGCHVTTLTGTKTRGRKPPMNVGDQVKVKDKWTKCQAPGHKDVDNSPELRLLCGSAAKKFPESSFLPLYLTRSDARNFKKLDAQLQEHYDTEVTGRKGKEDDDDEDDEDEEEEEEVHSNPRKGKPRHIVVSDEDEDEDEEEEEVHSNPRKGKPRHIVVSDDEEDADEEEEADMNESDEREREEQEAAIQKERAIQKRKKKVNQKAKDRTALMDEVQTLLERIQKIQDELRSERNLDFNIDLNTYINDIWDIDRDGLQQRVKTRKRKAVPGFKGTRDLINEIETLLKRIRTIQYVLTSEHNVTLNIDLNTYLSGVHGGIN
jgi:hypothetical protein